ncbi:hypothetical protein FLONG3_2111 [Fusarium longipes]|uniref:FAD-binding PCMH-type domain-containing protein n=1 Tax=Fusarium longipes TaxID=694270 RepID=A0A395T5L7_9HYPO|nr:hypothetical protein FLONG3_2111 [Fusarium longipes]
MATIQTFPSFDGNQFFPGTPSYELANEIYATSTYGTDRKLTPGAILQPASIQDIISVVKSATEQKIPIAIRSGGHQYSGASSTGLKGIQLDLKPTFRRPNLDLNILRENGKVYLRTSVSWSLVEMFEFLKANGVFMPTGQCAKVCLGGHVQTGGYGMLARSFGLLGDYVREIDIVDHSGEIVKVTKESHPDLFYGLLGGSPGNLGVITHFKIEVQDDNNYKGSKGLWQAFVFDPKTLEDLYDILVEKSQDPNFPRGYDMTVNVMSRDGDLLSNFPGGKQELKALLPNEIHDGQKNIVDVGKFKYALIIVYAQWVNFGDDQEPYSPDLFNRIKSVKNKCPFGKEAPEDAPMSAIAAMWLFEGDREFKHPYVKRTNTTTSTDLTETGWSKWFSERINEVIKYTDNGLWISSQMQVYGGKESMFWKNAGKGTSYCFRDATIGGTWDVFFQDDAEAKAKSKLPKDGANEWQFVNDQGMPQYFSKQDRRVLWGSYGDWDMKKVWPFYYDEETYKKIQEIRKKYDPNGTFTANVFSVEAV